MNRTRMKILAEVMNGAGLPSKFDFDMSQFYVRPQQEINTCGTSGCIAGLAVHLFGDRSSTEIKTDARRLLSLTAKEANALFFAELPNGKELDHEAVKKKHAAAVCEHAAKTGKIDWRKAGKLPLVVED